VSSISALSLGILVRCPTLIGLDLPLTTLLGIVRKRKKLLTYTQETIRANFERLDLERLIQGDQKTTTKHAMTLNKIKRLKSLLASIKDY
jgi:hypothetical protein